MDATPGHQNNFVVQESRFSRLKEPYPSNCYSNWNQTSYTKYVNGGKYNYSRTVRLELNADLFFHFFFSSATDFVFWIRSMSTVVVSTQVISIRRQWGISAI